MSVDTVPFTKQGYENLKQELEILKTVERPKVINEIAVARAHGDLRENAEYHAAREKQSFIEGRITLLDDRLARANIIDFSTDKPETIKFGAWVELENQDSGETKLYRIVGDLEADITKNLISLESPLARAIMGKKVDDVVELQVPKGTVEYLVTSIRYE